MSNDQLHALVDGDVLRPRLQFHELAGDHVEFDQLTSTTNYETNVVRSLIAGTATCVAGPRGGGKTSLIAHCCDQLPEHLVALRVPVIGMDDPGDPATVAATMITAALQAGEFEAYQRDALEAARADQTTIRRTNPSARAKLGGGVIPVELQGELASFGRDYQRGAIPLDRLYGVDRLITMFVARNTHPVFVIEDTEAMVGSPDSDETVTRFFARSLHMLAREIDAPTLIAVQDEFRDNPAYVELRAGMREVTLPVLDDPARAIATIVQHRMTERAGIQAAVDEVIDTAALDAFGEFYGEVGGSFRHTLAAIAASVEHAADVGVDRVEEHEARYGITKWRAQRP